MFVTNYRHFVQLVNCPCNLFNHLPVRIYRYVKWSWPSSYFNFLAITSIVGCHYAFHNVALGVKITSEIYLL